MANLSNAQVGDYLYAYQRHGNGKSIAQVVAITKTQIKVLSVGTSYPRTFNLSLRNGSEIGGGLFYQPLDEGMTIENLLAENKAAQDKAQMMEEAKQKAWNEKVGKVTSANTPDVLNCKKLFHGLNQATGVDSKGVEFLILYETEPTTVYENAEEHPGVRLSQIVSYSKRHEREYGITMHGSTRARNELEALWEFIAGSLWD